MTNHKDNSHSQADIEPVEPGIIEPVYFHAERFPVGSQASVDYLEEHGYVVVANALDQSECDKALDLTWDYLEKLETGVDRHD